MRQGFWMRQCFCMYLPALIFMCILPAFLFSMRQKFAGANILRFLRLRLIIVVMLINYEYHNYYKYFVLTL